jgi:IS5 family transposase
LLIGQWHGLSDPKLERALKVRLDFMIFCGLDLHAPVPDV